MLSEKFSDALMYAFELHANQYRKTSQVPYYAHLMAVASLTLEYGGNEDEAIAALLHDAIEDQGGDATRQEIRRRFGDTVTAIVDGCTETDITPWRERKESHISHIRNASASVKLVSAADKLHNILTLTKEFQSLGENVWSFFGAPKNDIFWYYRSIASAIGDLGLLSKHLTQAINVLEKIA